MRRTRSSDVSIRSPLRDLERDGEGRRTGRFPWRIRLLLRDRVERFCRPFCRVWSCDVSMRWDRERDLVRRRPRSPGLKELMRRRVLRSECEGEREWRITERRLRFVRALSSPCFLRRGGERDFEGERLVEMVDTESAEDIDSDLDRLRWRPDRSVSFFLRISSATPFLRNRSSGTSLVSFGFSLGLRSCCVRDGRD